MELYIETLTGTAFELRVSPFETIMSVKAKIQRLEGIPISHQHLIWQSIELEDDFCLHDYNIHSGATLKLVLAMRGGPINTRRIPVEDSALREMAEYMEANREEILDKLPGQSNVTLLVFREGDKLNFFRVVEPRPDGSPLSETFSPVYNIQDDEEEEEDGDEEEPKNEKTVENLKLKEKMDQLRVNMEKISLTKKKKHEKTPGHMVPTGVSRARLPGLASAPRSQSATLSQTLNKNMCLPPVGIPCPQLIEMDGSPGAASAYTVTLDPLAQLAAAAADTEPFLATTSNILPTKVTEIKTVNTSNRDSAAAEVDTKRPKSVRSDDVSGAEGGLVATTASTLTSVVGNADVSPITSYPTVASTSSLRRNLLRLGGFSDNQQHLGSSARRRETISLLETLQESRSVNHPAYSGGGDESGKMPGKRKVSERWEANSGFKNVAADDDQFKHSPIPSRKDYVLDLRPSTIARRKEFALEGLSSSEARTMSGILRQASIEKIGSSHIGSIVGSASKSRLTNFCIPESGRISTPENRMVSARLQRVSATGERHRISPTHRLPPVKAKKKQKRCCLCGKKTGLATSYQCRCGNNFCASHRYAESHDCTFDYKTEGRKLLEQSNPLVSAPKLPKI